MKPIEDAIAIVQRNLLRTITDRHQYGCILATGSDPNPAVWQIVFNGVANQILQNLDE